MHRWFMQKSLLDNYIRDKYTVELFNFLSYYANTDIAQEVEHQKKQEVSAQTYLASIILIDQFSRNIFRGQKEAFENDHLARKLAKYCVKHGIDNKLTAEQRLFMYLPYMHSESIIDQDEGIRLMEELEQSSTNTSDKKLATNSLTYAKQHRQEIVEFGRFPGRNEALGRTNTQREEHYLKK